MISTDKKVIQYVKKGHKKVDGWLSEIATQLIVSLAAIQRDKNIRGPICEVGVHHGKSFILLHLLTGNNELSVAWDLFEERQAENVDASGCGNRETFIKNLKSHECDMTRIHICTENSLNLSETRILQECGGKVRMFSIDGSHTSEATYHDMLLAANSLLPGGLIILDDFFNFTFPGVAEGTCKLIMEGKVRLFPVVIAGNKFIFTNEKDMAAYYQDGLMRFGGHKFIKDKTIVFGNDVLTIRHNDIPIISYLIKTNIWKSIRASVMGKLIRNVYYNINRFIRSYT